MSCNLKRLNSRKLLPFQFNQTRESKRPYAIHFLNRKAVIETLTYEEIPSELVKQFLDKNPKFCENYLLDSKSQKSSIVNFSSFGTEVDNKGSFQQNSLVKDQSLKRSIKSIKLEEVAQFHTVDVMDNTKLVEVDLFIRELQVVFQEEYPRASVLRCLYSTLLYHMDVDEVKIFLIDTSGTKLFLYNPFQINDELMSLESYSLKNLDSIATCALHYNECVTYPNVSAKIFVHLNKLITNDNILAIAIKDFRGAAYGVVQVKRDKGKTFFSSLDKDAITNYTSYLQLSHFFCDIFKKYAKLQEMNNYIMKVTQTIFSSVPHMENVIIDIMKHAKLIANAQRVGFFLVEKSTNELVAQIFDIGDDKKSDFISKKKDIRFPVGIGVAGDVASTGILLNIKDAYLDSRFNKEIDAQTGFKTKTILAIPVKVKKEVVAVLQIVNKTTGEFTSNDEKSLEAFAIYCGFALYITKMYNNIKHSEQKYKVALDVLSYHSCYDSSEFAILYRREIPNSWPELISFNFCPWEIDEMSQLVGFIFMFQELFGCHAIYRKSVFVKSNKQMKNKGFIFDKQTLMKFILTVKKNYRKVPYHNWNHAFAVGQAMFSFLNNTNHQFDQCECLALFISCFCHDLDHRGVTNEFVCKSDAVLGSLYSTSTMENHHFQMTVSILQRNEHNIFEKFDSEDFKRVLGLLRHNILATDLNLFFGNHAKIKKIIDNNQVDWKILQHRKLFMELCMTASDLCGLYKPWEKQLDFVNIIMQEFWDQGDLEKASGQVPNKMMDRSYSYEIPEMEVGFIQNICLPCYTTMAVIFDGIEEVVANVTTNLDRWKILKMLPINERMLKFSSLRSS